MVHLAPPGTFWYTSPDKHRQGHSGDGPALGEALTENSRAEGQITVLRLLGNLNMSIKAAQDKKVLIKTPLLPDFSFQ